MSRLGYGGAGIGLAIVAELTRAHVSFASVMGPRRGGPILLAGDTHGGRTSVHSEPGQGTTFTVLLPTADRAAPVP